MFELNGRTAVVTGAGNGIGRAVARSLADRGCSLALADIDEASVATTAGMLAGLGAKVSHHRLDVADERAVAVFRDDVEAEHGSVDILVNNAGVALGGRFEDVDPADFDWLFQINFWGVVRMSRAFLPLLKRSEEARLVNLSSLFGLVAPPGQTAYAAAKFAVRGFSESLRHELAGTPVGVTVVHPGGVRTSIATNARVPANVPPDQARREREGFQKRLTLPAEKAGEIIVKGIEQRKARVLVGSDARFVSLVERLAPVSHWSMLKKLM